MTRNLHSLLAAYSLCSIYRYLLSDSLPADGVHSRSEGMTVQSNAPIRCRAPCSFQRYRARAPMHRLWLDLPLSWWLFFFA